MSAIGLVLHLAGMPQETIDEIEKSSPAAAELINLFQQNTALINKFSALATEAQPVVFQLLDLYQKNQALFAKAVAIAIEAKPTITQAIPLINKASAEIIPMLPMLKGVVSFVEAQKAAAAAPSPYPAPDSY